MPNSLSRRSRAYSLRASRSEISLRANTSLPSATKRTTCRERPRCGISVSRSSVHSSSGSSHGRSSRPAAACAGGLKTKCTVVPGGREEVRSAYERGDEPGPRRGGGGPRPPLVGPPRGAAAAAQAAALLDAGGPAPPPLDVRAGDEAVGVVHPEPAVLPRPPAA